MNAPTDSRLPGGGGYPITVYVPTNAAAAMAAQNYITLETDFGPARTSYWHGVDFTLERAPAQWADRCSSAPAPVARSSIPARTASRSTVRTPRLPPEPPFQTTLRGLASYTVPKDRRAGQRDAALAAAAATHGRPGRCRTPSSRSSRPPAARRHRGRNTTIALHDNEHRLYADNRRSQVDMRFAKVLRFGRHARRCRRRPAEPAEHELRDR